MGERTSISGVSVHAATLLICLGAGHAWPLTLSCCRYQVVLQQQCYVTSVSGMPDIKSCGPVWICDAISMAVMWSMHMQRAGVATLLCLPLVDHLDHIHFTDPSAHNQGARSLPLTCIHHDAVNITV